MVEAGDAEPGIQPARFHGTGAGIIGELIEVREKLFSCKEGGVAVAAGDAAATYHAVEHCFDVGRDSIRTRGRARGKEPAAFVGVGEHCAFGWVEAAGLMCRR
jgi:hypothetical protein